MTTVVPDPVTPRRRPPRPAAPALPPSLDFELPPELEAHEPPEAHGHGRDDVRLLVAHRRTGAVAHHRFAELPGLLAPGDLLVVNVSGTLAAAVDTADGRTVHFSTPSAAGPAGRWLVELRSGGDRDGSGRAGDTVALPGGAVLVLCAPYTQGRLWVADVVLTAHPDVPAYLAAHGRPIRYGYVGERWPLAAYQTVFATTPGSAEMPSAGRAFTAATVVDLVAAGIEIAPITLHTGVASPEAHEPPYPEWYEVPAATAERVRAARKARHRVVAVGTTVVRALESAVDPYGRVAAARGWTDVVITPRRGVRAVDGLLTGWHEPRASHLLMLEAVAGRPVLRTSYAAALAERYRWHEFGDLHLLLP